MNFPKGLRKSNVVPIHKEVKISQKIIDQLIFERLIFKEFFNK